jgi:hypothetical protein
MPNRDDRRLPLVVRRSCSIRASLPDPFGEDVVMQTRFAVANSRVAGAVLDHQDSDHCVSSFVRDAGDEHIFRYDRVRREATLHMGVTTMPLRVHPGGFVHAELRPAELAWLQAVYAEAKGLPLTHVRGDSLVRNESRKLGSRR